MDDYPLLKGIAGPLLRFRFETTLATLADSDDTGQLYGIVHMRRARRSWQAPSWLEVLLRAWRRVAAKCVSH
jgi:hypothetical protein